MRLRFTKNPLVPSRTIDVGIPAPLYFVARDLRFGFMDDPLGAKRIVDTYELVTTKNPRTGRVYRHYRWAGEKT